MAKPTKNTGWASISVQQAVTIDGEVVLVPNKLEPSPEWQLNGELWRVNLPYPYVNYKLDELTQWVDYLDSLVAVGDFKVLATSETATTVGNRFGGTWTDHGTDTLAGQTIRLFERTA